MGALMSLATVVAIAAGVCIALCVLASIGVLFFYSAVMVRRKGSRRAIRLLHMTSKDAAANICAKKEIRGRNGIFAVEERVRAWPRAMKLVLSGLPPRLLHTFVEIPHFQVRYFWRVYPLGPYSLIKWSATTHVAPYRRLPYFANGRPTDPCWRSTAYVLYIWDAACLLLVFTYVIWLVGIQGMH
jgi:hypothetical protein